MRDKMNDLIGNAKGFTLIEVLLAMVIGTIILAAIYMATMEGHRASTGIEQKIAVQEDVRAALDIMAMEIGMASYNPTRSKNLWRAADCGTVANAYKGIQTAANFANSITIEADLNANGLIAEPNEVVTYTLDTVNQRITREANCGGAQSFIGDVTAASNRQRNVKVVNSALIPPIPMFRYYDSAGNEIVAASLPINIPQIRRIDITIAVIAADPDIQGQTRQIIHTTSVIPRNHAVTTL